MAHPASSSAPPPTRSGGGPLPDDWPTQAADGIARVVGQVRDRTTGPARSIARTIVYGLFALVLGTLALVLAGIFAVRILDIYIPGKVWIIYLGLGAVLTIAGLLLWRKAFTASAPRT